MDELRWFLLVIGVLVIAGVYGYARWQDRRRNGGYRRSPGKTIDEPDIDDAFRNLDATIGDINPVDPVERSLPMAPDVADLEVEEPDWRRETRIDKPRAKESSGAAPETAAKQLEQKVVVIHVAASNGMLYRGDQLVRALEDAGMFFGEHRIFHRGVDTDSGEIALFSAASMIEPGWFDVDNLDQMRSPGLALFMQLPAPFDGLAAFEQMLEAARQLAGDLDATLLDGRRCNLTQQAIEHIREELREYRRRAHLKARQQKR